MNFHCPQTLDEVTEATLKLLPRGRAWQTNEGLPSRTLEAAFNPAFFNPDVFSTVDDDGSVLWQYWRVMADMAWFFYVRLCALREEFWCASIVETRDEWMIEYGLPDECDPFPDLCVKVSAIGGTRCEYYAEVAARAGWSISCEENQATCGRRVRCQRVGHGVVGSSIRAGQMRIVVYVDDSPAYQPGGWRFHSNRMAHKRVGRRLACASGPNLLPLQCLLSRVIHAEIFTVYEVRTNGT